MMKQGICAPGLEVSSALVVTTNNLLTRLKPPPEHELRGLSSHANSLLWPTDWTPELSFWAAACLMQARNPVCSSSYRPQALLTAVAVVCNCVVRTLISRSAQAL